MIEVKKNQICGVCPGGCIVDMTFESGKLVSQSAAKDSPYGRICVRGKHAPEILYSEDRLTVPLIRIGKKGEGKFRQATWEEALDYTAEHFLRIADVYGPQALISHAGRGAFEQSVTDYLGISDPRNKQTASFFEPLGSPNVATVGSLCYCSFGVFAPMTTFGMNGPNIVPDIDNTDYLVVWGSNPATNSPPFLFYQVLAAKKRGCKMVAIDHFKTDICQRADQAVYVRSGTDGALVLALIHVIIKEKRYDASFVENYTHGFPELCNYVETFTPEYAAAITGVPAETIIELARELSSQKTAALLMYTGLEYSNSGVQTIRGTYILWALLGWIDVPGGMLLQQGKPGKRMVPFATKAIDIPRIGAKEYPLFDKLIGNSQFVKFPEAVLEGDPYPMKGLLNIGASISTSYPSTARFEEALKALDFFCTIDRYPTRDTLYADVVLPATTYFEDQSYQFYPTMVKRRDQVVEPIGEARQDLFILHDIAERLGYGELYPANEKELYEMSFALQPELKEALLAAENGEVPMTPEPRTYKKYETGGLREDGKPGFPTPTGKFEIFSTLLEAYGYPGLPEYMEPKESPLSQPELAKKYPLVLNSGTRIQTTFRSQHLNIDGLLAIQKNPEVIINATDAAERGIADGDKVLVCNSRGEVPFYAKVTDGIPQGEVEINMGGGSIYQAESWQKANANVLTDVENRDYISGFPVFKALLCDVKKAAAVSE